MMSPIIDQLEGEYAGKAKIGKVNVDEEENQPLVSEYGIQGIPAFKVFKGGKIVAEFTGARGEDEIKAEIDKHL